jgi:hypothetical protein
MHIFMDETGPFTGIGKEGSVSLIGAIVVPGSRLPKLGKLRNSFPLDDKGEVKGRLLNETQVASVISALHEHSALYAAMGKTTAGPDIRPGRDAGTRGFASPSYFAENGVIL